VLATCEKLSREPLLVKLGTAAFEAAAIETTETAIFNQSFLLTV